MKVVNCSCSFLYLIFISLSVSLFAMLQAQNVIQIEAGANQINTAVFQATAGDTIELITSGGLYQEDSTVHTSFPLTIRAAAGLAEKPIWELGDDAKLLKIGSDIWLKGFRMSGLYTDDTTDYRDSSQFAIKNADVIDYGYRLRCEDIDFDHVEHAFRPKDEAPYASEIVFLNCTFTDIRGRALRFSNPTTDPWQFGSLRIENCTAANIDDMFLRVDPLFSEVDTVHIFINHCTFYNVADDVIRVHPYRSDLVVKNSIFYNTAEIVLGPTGTVTFCDTINTAGFHIWGDPVPDIRSLYSRDPEFADTANYNFTVSDAFANSVLGDDGLVVGDLRWGPDIIQVPSEQPLIQTAIDAADDHDVIIVDPGTYVENLNFNGKSVRLASQFMTTSDVSYISQTVIDGGHNGAVVTFESGEDSIAILKGFTIRNGSADNGGGIKCSASSPTLEALIIQDNQAVNNGGGIYISNSARPILHNISILDNTCTNDDGGGIALDNSNGFFESVIISHNSVPSGVGGGIYLYNSSPDLINCLITNNSSQGDGGGIVCNEGSNARIINVTITENFANDGGGGFACGNSSPVFLNSILSGNTATWEQEFSIWDEYSEPNFNYCNTDMEEVGENNFYADPLFVDEENGDFHLSNLSPCIGAGTSVDAPEKDFEGNDRPDPPGSNPDIGAFENLLAEPWHATISTSPSVISQVFSGTVIDSQRLTIKNEGLADLGFNITTNFVTVIDSQNLALSMIDSATYLDIANPDSFDLESDFTISAWVKTDDAGVIVAKSSGLDEPGPKTLFISNGNFGEEGAVVFDVGWIGGLTGKRIINDNIWHHVALTSENNGDFLVKLYIDGTVDAEEYVEMAEYSTLGYGLRIGFDGREVHEFPTYNGDIDEVSIWNRALNEDELRSIMIKPPNGSDIGLSGYWPMNEESGTICYDSSSKNNNGTFEGSLERTISNVPYNPWMVCNPFSGNILVGNELEINVTLDATNLKEIDYQANIVVSSNDPYNPAIAIPVNLTVEPTAIDSDHLGIPIVFQLSQNYPNPFNPNTNINYELPITNDVEISIYNLLGQKVATLVSERQNAGYYQIEWDASGFASGVYYYHIQAGESQDVKKMILLR